MNEQSKRLEAIRNRCKTSSKVIIVIQTITLIAIVASLIGAIVCFAQRDMVDMHLARAVAEGTVQVDNLKISGGLFHLFIDYSQAFKVGNYAIPMFFNCIISAIICSIITVVLFMVKKIFDNLVKDENPFSDGILKKLKTIFVIIAVMILFAVGVGPCVIMSLLMWCIYTVLEYGKALQTEVDELL